MRRTVLTALSVLTVLTVLAAVPLLPAAAQGRRGKEAEKPLPLEPTRKAEFSTTQGTWISLDVSPDGKTIVFDLLGDIYTMPITGGHATRITTGMAYDAQPRFSPDGQTIAFISDRSGGDNLWTMRMDFTDTTQVTMGNSGLYLSPEWSPDGQYIVVSHSSGLGGTAKLEMYQVGRHTPAAGHPGPRTDQDRWGGVQSRRPLHLVRRAERRLAVQRRLSPVRTGTGTTGPPGTLTTLTNRYGSGFRPAVSPDGGWLVYGTREGAQTGLRLRNLTNGDERWLAYPVQRDEMESRAPLDVLPGYSFTPDSKSIVVSYGGEIWRVPLDGSAATKIPFQADVKLDIGPEVKFVYRVDTAAAVTAHQIRSPVLSPDGRRLAFTAFDRLWIKDMPDGTPRRVSTADVGEYHPAWSPDGRSLAFVTWDDSAGGQIMRAPADGRGPVQQVTRVPALYYNLAWSPDGTRIVATRGAARDLKEAFNTFNGPLGGEFVWVPATGGDITVISPTAGRDVAHFRMDQPDRIYAFSFREGLVSFRWDGTDVKRIIRVVGPASNGSSLDPDDVEYLPRQFTRVPRDADSLADLEGGGGGPPAGLIMISPRGGRVLAQVGDHVYEVDIPEVGGPVPVVAVTSPAGAPIRIRKLTEIGGEFPAWTADGSRITWSIGNAFDSYDLARVEAQEDSAQQADRARVGRALQVRGILDSLKAVRKLTDSLTKAKLPVPDSLKNRLNALVADSVRSRADSILALVDSLRAKAAAIRNMADSVRAGRDTAKADSALMYKASEVRITVTMPRDIPRGVIVLRGGRIVTMKGHEVIERGDVVIRDNRIIAVGPTDSVQVPDGAQIIDVSGKTLVPGFVDTHYHAQWLIPEIHPRQAWQYLTNLAYGVTTTRDPQTGSTDILSYEDMVETGAMVGPRTYSTGPGVFSGENLQNLDQARSVLKRYSEYYDTHTLKMYMTGNRQQRQWIIQAARELHLMPTTEGGLDYKLDLTHAIDGYPGVEHSLPIDPIYDDVIHLFKASQTTNSPTLLVSYGGPFGENWFFTHEMVHDDPKLRHFVPEDHLDWKSRRRGSGAGGSPGPEGWFLDEEYVFRGHADYARRLIQDSARAAIGSHGQMQGLGYHWEMWAMATGGLSNHDVLRMATIYGAEAIGMGQDLGSIEPGKMADVLVLDQNPLENIRNTNTLRYVMKNGRLYDAGTLDEVAPQKRTEPTQPWQRPAIAGVEAGIR